MINEKKALEDVFAGAFTGGEAEEIKTIPVVSVTGNKDEKTLTVTLAPQKNLSQDQLDLIHAGLYTAALAPAGTAKLKLLGQDAPDDKLIRHQVMGDGKLIIRLVLGIGIDQHPKLLLLRHLKRIIPLFHLFYSFRRIPYFRSAPLLRVFLYESALQALSYLQCLCL